MRRETGLLLSAFATGEPDFESAAAMMSEARISPPAPEPWTSARLTPASLARRRAFGEILMVRVIEPAGGTVWFVVLASEVVEGAATVVLLPDAAATSSAGAVSPGRTI